MSNIKRNQCWFYTAIFILWCLTSLSSASGYQDNSGYHDNTIHQNANPDQVLLHSILERLASLDQRLNSFDLRFTSLEQRMSSLEQNLGRRFTSLEQRFNNLDQQINQLASKTSVPSGSSSGENSEITTPKPKTNGGTEFRFTRVTKTEQEDSYTVRIEYDGPPVPKFMKNVRVTLSYEQVETNPQETGVVEADISKEDLLKHHCNMDYCREGVRFRFIYPDNVYEITVYLNASDDTMEVPHTAFQVTPVTGNGVTVKGHDIIFKSGSKLFFDVKIDVNNETDHHRTETSLFSMVYVKSETEEDRVIRSYSWNEEANWSLIAVEGGVKLELASSLRDGRVQLNTTKKDLEGILETNMDVRFHDCESGRCLVRSISLPYAARFYREDHEGPFGSKDFIGFVTDEWTFKQNSSYDVVCNTRKPAPPDATCHVMCEALGGNEVRTNIVPLTPVTNTDTYTMHVPELDYSASMLTINDVTTDADGDYVCHATNTNGVTKTRVFSVLAIRAPQIDRERTKVTKFENGSLLARCVADGDPLPEVGFEGLEPDLQPTDYVITYIALNETTIEADLFIKDRRAASRAWGFTCKAQIEEETDYHYLSTYYGDW